MPARFSFTPAEREKLHMFLKRGGTLMADSICANQEFTDAFRREMQSVFAGDGDAAASGNSGLLTVTQIGTGMLLGAGTFWWAEPVHIAWSGAVWIALAVTSMLATALAFFVQTWAQRWISPTRTALISSLEPVFAWGTSYVLAGEVLSRRGMLGTSSERM